MHFLVIPIDQHNRPFVFDVSPNFCLISHDPQPSSRGEPRGTYSDGSDSRGMCHGDEQDPVSGGHFDD
jgi:hypothetical protein